MPSSCVCQSGNSSFSARQCHPSSHIVRRPNSHLLPRLARDHHDPPRSHLVPARPPVHPSDHLRPRGIDVSLGWQFEVLPCTSKVSTQLTPVPPRAHFIPLFIGTTTMTATAIVTTTIKAAHTTTEAAPALLRGALLSLLVQVQQLLVLLPSPLAPLLPRETRLRATELSRVLSSHVVSGPFSYARTLLASTHLKAVLFILLLICFTCWCRRRRRTRQQQAQAAAMAAATSEMKEHTHSSTPLLVQQHPPNPRSRSIAATDSNAVPGPLYFADSPGRRETEAVHNAAPSTETDDGRSLLPNPYDADTPPQLPPRDLLFASPTSPTGPTAWSYSTPTQDASNAASSRVSRRVSAAPSAWTHDEPHSDAASASSVAPLLARGDTQASRLTASSSLHEEMAGYQKRLEAHHRKESEDAIMREQGIGVGASVPADPPPVYSAAVDM